MNHYPHIAALMILPERGATMASSSLDGPGPHKKKKIGFAGKRAACEVCCEQMPK